MNKPDWERIRDRIRTYVKRNSEGHSVKIKEPDISHAFRMLRRTDRYNIHLSQISAHTFKIMEIIQQERSNIRLKKQKQFEREIKNG